MAYEKPFGAFLGRTLLQRRGDIGGSRFVFVKLQGSGKYDLVFPPIGGKIENVPSIPCKMYAGDLFEYKIDGTILWMRTFEVAEAVEATGTSIKIVKNGYRHIPAVGDVLMKAPNSLSGTGAAYAVTAVDDSNSAYWTITVGTTLGALAKGDVLVEGVAAGAAKKMLVTNPNAMAPCDYDIPFAPASSSDDFDGARYFLTPVLHGTAYASRMSPIPACAKSINRSLVDGLFEL